MKKAFTLVELLVAMSILAILSTVGLASFRSSQLKSRDAQRKSDLKQIANALEIFNNDYGRYPSSDNGKIKACSYPSGVCTWGESEMSDVKTIYLRKVPADPSGYNYYYRTRENNKAFQIYAYLENTQDKNLITLPITSYPCGEKTCNFAITSSNVGPMD